MFLQLNHQRLEVYKTSKLFVLECYRLSNSLPVDEKFGMISQIRRAALSVHLNVAEGASRKSEAERKRFYEIARGSIIEIDAALDVAKDMNYLDKTRLDLLGKYMIDCFKMLTGIINSKPKIKSL
jgi:four helix bundle protein